MRLVTECFDRFGSGAGGKAAALAGPWAELGGALVTTQARTGAVSMQVGGGANTICRCVLGVAAPEIYAGAGIYIANNLPSGADACQLMQLCNAANTPVLTVVLQPTGALAIKRGNGDGALLGTSSALMTTSSWASLQLHALIHDSAGVAELRLNNELILSLTGIDTDAVGTGEVSIWRTFNRTSTGALYYVDDLIINDSSGADEASWPGDQRVYWLPVAGPGASADWTPAGSAPAATNWESVDDPPPPDGDTTYVETDTAGQVDSYALDASALAGAQGLIKCVTACLYAMKSDAGDASARANIRSGTAPNTVATGPDRALTTAWQWHQAPFYADPVSDVPFTFSDISGLEVQAESR